MARHTDIEHPTLGRLEYDNKSDWYTAKVSVDGRVADLNIECRGAKCEPPALRHAVRLAGKIEKVCRAAKECAVRDLLALKNDRWRNEGEPEVDADEFERLMTLEGIAVDEDGSAEFYYLDGDLFRGHCILVRRDKRGRLQQAAIAG